MAEGLDAVDVESFTLIGHSLGGAVAAALAELSEPAPQRGRWLDAPAPPGWLGVRLRCVSGTVTSCWAAMRISFLSAGATPTAGIGTSISTVPAA